MFTTREDEKVGILARNHATEAFIETRDMDS
jgi:hypothetical protein